MPRTNKRKQTLPWSKRRKGDFWSDEEEEYLEDCFNQFVSQQAKEHGRSKVAILCRLLKLIED
jgi:hypothetical protein|tara:strand:- start:1121 stop:1309 length:189 start_codon:yes stop_codon:yes gene_type:complete